MSPTGIFFSHFHIFVPKLRTYLDIVWDIFFQMMGQIA